LLVENANEEYNSAVFGRAYQRPLGRTLQRRRTFDRIGMSERMAGVEAPFYRERTVLSARFSDGSAVRKSGVIPKPCWRKGGLRDDALRKEVDIQKLS
jgi:hypothetical protein